MQKTYIMKPIIALIFLITLMLMGAPVVNDTLNHTSSGKGAAAIQSSARTQNVGMSITNAGKPCVQSAKMQQNANEAGRNLPGKNTANLIIIL
jgi:hypothetical protein